MESFCSTLKKSTGLGASAVSLQMFLFMTFGNFSNASYSPLSVFIKPEFNITTLEVGLITSSIFLGALTMFFFVGILVDRLGSGTAIRISFAFIALGSLIALIAGSYIELIVGYYTIGFGYGAITPATNSAVMEKYYPSHSTPMGIKQAGVPVGAALSSLVLPVIAFRLSLRYSFLAMLIVSLVLILFVGRSRRRKRTSRINYRRQIRGIFGVMLHDKPLVAISMTTAVLSWGQQTLMTYYVLFMTSVGYEKYIAIILLFLIFAGAVFGRISWMRLGPRAFGGDRIASMALISAIAGVLILAFPYLSVDVYASGVLAFFLGMNAVAWNSTYVTVISELAPTEKIGQYSGSSLMFLTFGTVIGAPVSGYIAYSTGSYYAMWIILGISLLVGSLIFGTIVRKLYKERTRKPGIEWEV